MSTVSTECLGGHVVGSEGTELCEPVTSICDLPDELLLEIFRRLTPGQMGDVSCVCHRWDRLGHDVPLQEKIVGVYARRLQLNTFLRREARERRSVYHSETKGTSSQGRIAHNLESGRKISSAVHNVGPLVSVVSVESKSGRLCIGEVMIETAISRNEPILSSIGDLMMDVYCVIDGPNGNPCYIITYGSIGHVVAIEISGLGVDGYVDSTFFEIKGFEKFRYKEAVFVNGCVWFYSEREVVKINLTENTRARFTDLGYIHGMAVGDKGIMILRTNLQKSSLNPRITVLDSETNLRKREFSMLHSPNFFSSGEFVDVGTLVLVRQIAETGVLQEHPDSLAVFEKRGNSLVESGRLDCDFSKTLSREFIRDLSKLVFTPSKSLSLPTSAK